MKTCIENKLLLAFGKWY